MSEEAWLRQLPDSDRRHAEGLLRELATLGCRDPYSWAGAEIEADIPQLARYRFLHDLWPRLIDAWPDAVTGHEAARRAVRAGASPDDLGALARTVAYETVAAMLVHLADEHPPADLPSWRLTEVDATGAPTGRGLLGLDTDLPALDPSTPQGGRP